MPNSQWLTLVVFLQLTMANPGSRYKNTLPGRGMHSMSENCKGLFLTNGPLVLYALAMGSNLTNENKWKIPVAYSNMIL